MLKLWDMPEICFVIQWHDAIYHKIIKEQA